MSVSTISGSVGNFITLGSGSYANLLTITSTGTVSVPHFHMTSLISYPQIELNNLASTLVNEGQILAGGGTISGFDSFAATGVDLAAGYVRNSGAIIGGYIGVGGNAGGPGVTMSGGSLYNSGLIAGGPVPVATFMFQPADGIVMTAGSVTNDGTICGGAGSDGLSLSGGVFVNNALLAGAFYVRSPDFYAGSGATVSSGVLINTGTVAPGGGFNSGPGGGEDVAGPGIVISGGTVINSGTIGTQTVATETGVALNAGVFTNTGLVLGAVEITGTASPSRSVGFSNAGTIDGSIAVSAADISNSGLVEGGVSFARGTAGLTLGVGSDIAGSVSAVAAYTVTVYGTVSPSLPTIVTISDMTNLDLAAGSIAGSLDMGGSYSGFDTIDFGPGASWVLGGTAAELAAGQSITGFELGDTLVLDGFSASSHAFAAGELTLSNAAQSLTLDLAGSFSGLLVTDVAQGTEIAVCYLRGTPILTPAGERAIEDLRIGDEVVTRFGGVRRIKWIGEQRYASRFLSGNAEMLPVCIGAGALGQGVPSRDLFVSPGHSLLLDGRLVLAKLLVNGVTIRQHEVPDEVHYLNIELPAHDCVLAAGAWAESYAECAVTRHKFHNAADFFARFAGHVAPAEPALCATRPMTGTALAEALAPVVARAAAGVSAGALRGYIDVLAADGRVEGWAQDAANPELPVWLEVLRDGEIVDRVLACAPRADLRAAGVGSGRHAFQVKIPGGSGRIELRRAADGAKLPLTVAAQAA